MKEKVTTREAAVLFGLNPDTLKKWFQRGHIQASRQGRRTLLFNRKDVEQIVRERLPELLIPRGAKELRK